MEEMLYRLVTLEDLTPSLLDGFDRTQPFYRSVGCILAAEINQEILAKEPLDIQLERTL